MPAKTKNNSSEKPITEEQKTPSQPKKQAKSQRVPVIPTRGIVVFPGGKISLEVDPTISGIALRYALKNQLKILLLAIKNPMAENPRQDDLYRVGVLADAIQVLDASEDSINLVCQAEIRAQVVRFAHKDAILMAQVEPITMENPKPEDENLLEVRRRAIVDAFRAYCEIVSRIPAETVDLISQLTDLNQLCDVVLINLPLPVTKRQEQLELTDLKVRMESVQQILAQETELAKLGKKISAQVHESMDASQREYYLREQERMIRAELGEDDQGEIAELEKQLEESSMPEEYKTKLKKEIGRLSRMPENFPETAVQRNWIDCLLELPFGRLSEENLDLEHTKKVLDQAHYGLEKVKERILEYVAVRNLQVSAGDHRVRGPILCLVGPPGVGKTSIGQSVAEALGRKLVRMSLGGISDEAEIRGHRRTYVGAMPGRIIQGIRQAGTDNPLILLDEVDKLGKDYRGDPSSALLEVLDPEQNNSFRDHYVEFPYDLSKVLFITTANTAWSIPQPLIDRMELIELNGYTDEEKIQIAKRHLVPRQMEAHALKKNQLKLTPGALAHLISDYTSESGVRELDRVIAKLCRKIAVKISRGEVEEITVREKDLESILGRKTIFHDTLEGQKYQPVGCATGLAWTSAGGETLTIEVNVVPGQGHMELTGSLGEVMKESAKAALTYVRSIADKLGIDPNFTSRCDLHIHVPAGAIPKDGPSAGITLVTALVSALTGRPVRKGLAMTGEITLRGRVMPIGGLKEKAVAGKRAGVTEILIPWENLKDVEDIPESVQKVVTVTPVKTADDVLRLALLKDPVVETAVSRMSAKEPKEN